MIRTSVEDRQKVNQSIVHFTLEIIKSTVACFLRNKQKKLKLFYLFFHLTRFFVLIRYSFLCWKNFPHGKTSETTRYPALAYGLFQHEADVEFPVIFYSSLDCPNWIEFCNGKTFPSHETYAGMSGGICIRACVMGLVAGVLFLFFLMNSY